MRERGNEGRREGRKLGRREGGKEGRREGEKEGRREGGKEGRREGGMEGKREGWKETRREEGKEGKREGEKERRSEGEKEEGREGTGTWTAVANGCAFSFSLAGVFCEPVERTQGTSLPHFFGSSSRVNRTFSSASATIVSDMVNQDRISAHMPMYSAWKGSKGSCFK
jgi:hypothetical protein